jgi:hypothetical protein
MSAEKIRQEEAIAADVVTLQIRYDIYQEGEEKFESRFFLIMLLSETLKQLKERIQSWETYDVHLIGYEVSESEDAPLYDEDVTLGSVYKDKIVLVFSNVSLANDELK